tara:strand:+ start:2018 stop:3091 length:1074 start_codon:yes stop_codon:yes gene_type:complete
MKDITTLLTSCNGLTSPGIIDCMKEVEERKINIIGVDINKLGAGSRMVDKFFEVPTAESSDYVGEIYSICKENKVDVIVPASDEESLILSKEKDRFLIIGVKISTNDYEVAIQSTDKGNFLNFIKEKELPCAKYKLPKNMDEFEECCYNLGYPEDPVVIKPRIGRGNRGMRIIQKSLNKGELLLYHKPGTPYTTLEDIKEALTSKELESFPDVVLMEYLPGEEYSVDVLVKDGTPLIVVPKKRLMPVPGLSLIGQVDLNEEVIEAVTEICNVFNFNYNVNIQFRFSKDNKLYPYEVNTRVAASIAACKEAGANLFYYGIKLALDEELPEVNIIDGMKMIRYYKEYYEYESNNKSNSF